MTTEPSPVAGLTSTAGVLAALTVPTQLQKALAEARKACAVSTQTQKALAEARKACAVSTAVAEKLAQSFSTCVASEGTRSAIAVLQSFADKFAATLPDMDQTAAEMMTQARRLCAVRLGGRRAAAAVRAIGRTPMAHALLLVDLLEQGQDALQAELDTLPADAHPQVRAALVALLATAVGLLSALVPALTLSDVLQVDCAKSRADKHRAPVPTRRSDYCRRLVTRSTPTDQPPASCTTGATSWPFSDSGGFAPT